MKKRITLLILVQAALVCLHPPAASAADTSETSTESVRNAVLNLIRALVDQGVLSAAKAQDMLRQAGIDPALLNTPQVSQAAPSEPPKPVVRVPYVPESVKDEMREELRQEIVAQAREEHWGQPGALPEWLSRFTPFGDIRIRYQREQYASDNAAPQTVDAWYQLPVGTTKDTSTERGQQLIRARLGFDAQVSENFKTQIRIVGVNGDTLTASGVSYNVDEGSYGRPFSAGIDLANIEWRPDAAWKATFGRMLRPYAGTDLLFANDLSFDGIVGNFGPRFSSSWNGFATLGVHPLTSNWVGPYSSTANAWLFAGQLGANWKAADESNLQMAAAYYDYVGLEGELNPASVPGNTLNANSAPPFRTMGNTMFNINWYSNPTAAPVYAYASKFRLADALARYETDRFEPIHLTIAGEWVRNLGFHADEILNRIQGAALGLPQDSNGMTGVSRPRTTGYLIGFDVSRGEMKHLGDWELFGGYRYLERDSVPDAFTSVDYRLGGTDQRASYIGVNTALSARVGLRIWMNSAKQIDAPIKYGFDTWFIDLYSFF